MNILIDEETTIIKWLLTKKKFKHNKPRGFSSSTMLCCTVQHFKLVSGLIENKIKIFLQV